jgi:hypothetical protein
MLHPIHRARTVIRRAPSWFELEHPWRCRRSAVIGLLLTLLVVPSLPALAQDQLPDEATGLDPARPYLSVLPWEKIDV